MGFWSSVGSALSGVYGNSKSTEKNEEYEKAKAEIDNFQLDDKGDRKPPKPSSKKPNISQLKSELDELNDIDDVKKYFDQ